ncbi:MAG: hypothetical protein EHM35_02450 [Planctomycetaceae bacterium]|nr:MAG: hypothetical protein EHM35_02450 [Planctomycetaceae bacterium]
MAKENVKTALVTALVAMLVGGGGGIGVQRVFPSRPQRAMTGIGDKVASMELTLSQLRSEFSAHTIAQDRERLQMENRLEKQDVRAEKQDTIAEQLAILVGTIGGNTNNLREQMTIVQYDVKQILEKVGRASQ